MSKHHGSEAKPLSSAPPAHPLKRRGVLVGAGAAGAAALALKALPEATPAAPAVSAAVPKLRETSGGYQLSEHVLRYYETTRS
jgi:hypothetical protein